MNAKSALLGIGLTIAFVLSTPSIMGAAVVCTTMTGCPGASTGNACKAVVNSFACDEADPINCTFAGKWTVEGKYSSGPTVKFWAECGGSTVAECWAPESTKACSQAGSSGSGKGGCWHAAFSWQGATGSCVDPLDPMLVLAAVPVGSTYSFYYHTLRFDEAGRLVPTASPMA